MNEKYNRITSARWATVPYTAGSGLHIGCGTPRTFPNAVGIDVARAPGVDLVMRLDRFPLYADGCFDWVVIGDAQRRVAEPRAQLADAWRVLGQNGYLILVQPTRAARDWIVGDLAAYPDLVEHPAMRLGEIHVDVLQKLAPGEGRHVVAPLDAEKTCAIVRTGGYGDVLWAASILPALKAEGYHVTVYTWKQGEEILRHDPNVDALRVVDELRIGPDEDVAFWEHERARYDRWINLTESVEKNMLAVPNDLRFYWPEEARRLVFGGSYIEAVHDLAGVPRKYEQRFYPTREEFEAALAARGDADLVAVIAPSGSTLPKWWPYTERLAGELVAKGYQVWILGDLRGAAFAVQPGVHVIGTGWPMRQTLAFAQQADLVIGEETAITNAVALEPMRKIVLLSHSSARNLTTHWKNTVALHGDAACWPCHRIHYIQNGWQMCNLDKDAEAARCQSTITVERVMAAVNQAYVLKAA